MTSMWNKVTGPKDRDVADHNCALAHLGAGHATVSKPESKVSVFGPYLKVHLALCIGPPAVGCRVQGEAVVSLVLVDSLLASSN